MKNFYILFTLSLLFSCLDSFPCLSNTQTDVSKIFLKIKDKQNKFFAAPKIIVNLPSYELFFIIADKVESYPVRIGKKSHPTEIGKGYIINKIRKPVFRYTIGDNAGEVITQSRIYDQPNGKLIKVIPMPYEDMRSLEPYINGKRNGQMIHSTTNSETIGYPWSSGCIGLKIDDMLKLYEKVPLHTELEIRYDVLRYNENTLLLYADVYNRKPDILSRMKSIIPQEQYRKLDQEKLKKLSRDYHSGMYLKTVTEIPLRQLQR